MRTRWGVLFALTWGVGCGETIGVGPSEPSTTSEPSSDRPTRVLGGRLEAGDRVWSLTGEALDGGGPLTSLPGHGAFWFAWSAFHPGTSVWGEDQPISGRPPAPNDRCTVPCQQIQPACSGRDCIPALVQPEMVKVDAAPEFLRDDDEVLGVLTPAGPRAYPHNVLWWHEIINESVGGMSYAVTYCPLTGSGLVFDRRGFVDGEEVILGVSGNLYNSNLTMYDRLTRSWWSQMRVEAVLGPARGKVPPLLPVFEMTWQAWRTFYPETLVVSENTGHTRNYQTYPYGGYRTDDSNTFRLTDPRPDPRFSYKAPTFGLFVGGEVRGYPWSTWEAEAGRRQGAVPDQLGGEPVLIVFDLNDRYVHAFSRNVDGETLDIQFVASP